MKEMQSEMAEQGITSQGDMLKAMMKGDVGQGAVKDKKK